MKKHEVARHMRTQRSIEYPLPMGGKTVIPKGTRYERARNLPDNNTSGIRYWAKGWRGMKEHEKSHHRNYGYGLSKKDIE